MKQYHDILSKVLTEGVTTEDRTGTGTVSYFGAQMRYDLSEGFPLVTTKKLHLKSIIHELLWFLSGNTNIQYLKDNGVRIWDEWADENGDLGPVYGHQWRHWPHFYEQSGEMVKGEIDQIADLIKTIRTNPTSRRMLVSAWNVGEVNEMALPPCHTMWQCKVLAGKLHLQLYQRSADLFLGVPFNIASYALLTHMIALVCDLEPGTFVHTLGDAHIYSNHIDQVKLQLSREPRPLPQLTIKRKPTSLFDFTYDDFEVTGYDPHPHIAGKVAV